MNLNKRHSVSKLQKEINKELSNLKIKRNFSYSSFPSYDSLRSSFSKSVQSIFLDGQNKKAKNSSFKEKSPSPKSLVNESKMGRSQEAMGLKNPKSTAGKLKKKKS
jgi:hypothetical protein